MATQIKYKNYLLSDCNKRQNKEDKLKCIERGVHLDIGNTNYVDYQAKRS